jgi:hypothetical protein
MYNKDSDSLNAGAPDIRLSGDQQMASMEPSQESTLEDIYYELIGMGFSPEEAAKRAREFYDEMSKAPQQDSGIMAAAPGTYTQQRKQMMAGGGIAGLEKRQGYFLGDLVRKIKDDIIPNELKENPIATALLGGAAVNQLGLPDFLTESMGMGSDVGQNWLGNLLGAVVPGDTQFNTVFGDTLPFSYQDITSNPLPGGLDQLYKDILKEDMTGIQGGTLSSYGNYLKEIAAREAVNKLTGQSNQSGSGITQALSSAASPYLGEGEGRRVNPLYPLGIGAAVGKYVEGLPKDELPMDTTSIDPAAIAAAARGTDAEGAAAGLRFLPEQVTRAAQGGRIGAQEGGLMDLGGMEKDYRNEGGFVALGGEEKADDVPARLSKNEFVFTADAVRGAGGGDIDKGAEIMEDLMNNLEGARGMFANAQKLQNRII